MVRTLDFKFFDADNHFYEPRDVFTRHIDPAFAHTAVRPVLNSEGREVLMVGDKPFTFLPGWSYDKAAAPGALKQMLRKLSTGNVEGEKHEDVMEPAYIDRAARLRVMDEQNVESAVMLPTLGVTVEHFLKEDADATYANLRAFNTWLDEEWGFDYQGRIYSPPLMSLLDVDRAVTELEWALDRGARLVHLRPGPAFGRSPADPHFDPFWARINEAKIAVAFHVSESGYNEMFSTAWGEEPNPPSHKQSAFQWINFFGDRPIMDTLSALVMHNLFGRFPDVKVVSIENGSLWVPYLYKVMDKMKGMGRNGPWIGGRLTERPSEVFRRHVFVSPHHEEDIVGLARLIGASQVIFGSDWPHPEGLATPAEYAEGLEGLNDAEVRMIMRDNARGLIGATLSV